MTLTVNPSLTEFAEFFNMPTGMPESCPIQKMNSTENGAGEAPLFHNRAAPAYERQSEKPHYRLMLELSAKGYTNTEIAMRLGVSLTTVNDILRQSFYQQPLVNQVRRETEADEEVVEVIRANVVKAVETLAEIVTDPDARKGDRIAAANALLDRRYGKPNQPINRGTDVDLSKLSDSDLVAMLPNRQRN